MKTKIEEIIKNYEMRAESYSKEHEALDDRQPLSDLGETIRHAETRVLFNACLQFKGELIDLLEALKGGES